MDLVRGITDWTVFGSAGSLSHSVTGLLSYVPTGVRERGMRNFLKEVVCALIVSEYD